jgi:hypothetical protein
LDVNPQLVVPDFFGVLHHAADNAAQTPSPGTPSVLPRPAFHSSGNVGRTYLDSDPPQSPQPVQAPNCTPNVVLILIDFGQFSTFVRRRAVAHDGSAGSRGTEVQPL